MYGNPPFHPIIHRPTIQQIASEYIASLNDALQFLTEAFHLLIAGQERRDKHIPIHPILFTNIWEIPSNNDTTIHTSINVEMLLSLATHFIYEPYKD